MKTKSGWRLANVLAIVLHLSAITDCASISDCSRWTSITTNCARHCNLKSLCFRRLNKSSSNCDQPIRAEPQDSACGPCELPLLVSICRCLVSRRTRETKDCDEERSKGESTQVRGQPIQVQGQPMQVMQLSRLASRLQQVDWQNDENLHETMPALNIIGFLLSMLLVAFVWCLLCIYQQKLATSAGSGIFVSTPGDYTAISSLAGQDSAFVYNDLLHMSALLNASDSDNDTPSYADSVPPTYAEAVQMQPKLDLYSF